MLKIITITLCIFGVILQLYSITSAPVGESSSSFVNYNFNGDIVYSQENDHNIQDINQGNGRSMYALDEHYRHDETSNLHNKWSTREEIEWMFDCSSLSLYENINGKLPLHIGWNNESRTFTWIQLSTKDCCTMIKLLIDTALREWLDPLADRISHTPDRKLYQRDIVRVAFTNYNHNRSDGTHCVFDNPNVLAHANEDFVHINSHMNWCIIGSKSPRYILTVNNKGDQYLQHIIDANYGRMLTKFIHDTATPLVCINLYAVILHELGHTIGLSHASLPSSLMYPTALDPLNYVHSSDTTFVSQLFRN